MKAYGQLSTKGQVVIPSEFRQKYGLAAGTRVSIEGHDGCIVLRPITDAFIDSIAGSLGGPSMADMREREHRDDER